jgi:hypothetical protein
MAHVWLAPGKTSHWQRNNVPYNCVFAFNASPIADVIPSTMDAEVERVWRRNIQSETRSEAEVHVRVKNTSSVAGYCFIFWSYVGP